MNSTPRVVLDTNKKRPDKKLSSLIKLHDKYGWKEQLREDVGAVRAEVRKKGGINSQTIDNAVKRYRKTISSSDA